MRNRDSCSTCFALLGAIARCYDLTLPYCWDLALDEIEGRTGRTVDGVFVKDAQELPLGLVTDSEVTNMHVVIGKQRFEWCKESERYVEVEGGVA